MKCVVEFEQAVNRYVFADDASVLQQLSLFCGETREVVWNNVHSGIMSSVTKLQSRLGECWQNYRANQLQSALTSTREKLRLTSCRGPESGAFLRVTVLSAARRMSNDAFVTAICLRIGHSLSILEGLRRCDCKRNSAIDPYGDHVFTCPKGNHRQLSHNALNLVLSEMCHCAGVHNKTEHGLRPTSDQI